MAQVRKYQSGGLATTPNDPLIDVGGVKYLKSDVVNIFKNQTLRNSYSKDFVGNNDELDALFNQIADIYAEGLNSGKMRFDSDGRHIIDPSGKYYNIDKIIEKPKTSQDFFNNQSVRVMNMFEIAKSKGYIRSWESLVNSKTPYVFDEKTILTLNFFHKPADYGWENLRDAWFALDPMDKATGLRSFSNRKKTLADAIITEANKIDNDPSYRKKFRFDGETNNPLAYQQYTLNMRKYAEMIANLNGFDETLLNLGTSLGTNPRLLYSLDPEDLTSLFTPITDEALEIAKQKEEAAKELAQKEQQRREAEAEKKKQELQNEIISKGILRNFDPLATSDTQFFENNAYFNITDNLSGISPYGQQLANFLSLAYSRELIGSNWYSWQQFKGKYLENLTNYFSLNSGYHVYALTNGPLSHKGKRFFIKKPNERNPIEVLLRRIGVDYYAYDTKGNQVAKLGEYSYDHSKTSILTIEDLQKNIGLIKPTALSKDEDTGEPIKFATSLAFADLAAMDNYWTALGSTDISVYDPRRFEDVLKGVSMQFLSLSLSDLYKYNAFNTTKNPRTWLGTRFALYVDKNGHVVFSWIRGNNEFAFVSKLTREEFKKYLKTLGNVKFIDYGFIDSVYKRNFNPLATDMIGGYKEGGKLNKLSEGGSIFDTYNSQINLGMIKPQLVQPLDIPKPVTQEPQTEQQLLEAYLPPEEFTIADGVRLGASILDLTGAFMMFPKGLNMASAAVSGVSLAGYIGADLADVISGKKELWPTLKHDAEIAGVQAIALVNPVKAGQIAPALAKIVPMIPHIAGILWTYDILTDDNSRKSIMNTLGKLLLMKISEINQLDLTNLAFIARTLIGAKMGASSLKNKAKGKVQSIKNNKSLAAEVAYRVNRPAAEGTEGTFVEDVISIEKGYKRNKKSEKLEDVKQRVVDEYNRNLGEGETKITKENVQILDKLGGKEITTKEIPLDFKPTTDVMTETWAPGRLFEKAVQHGSFENGHVTRQSTWLGRQLRKHFGEDFDVPFSDEAIYRNKLEIAVQQLAANLFGGMEGIKAQAQLIKAKQATKEFKEASPAEKETMMQEMLKDSGYLYIPKTEETPIYEGALNKANEIVQVADNLNSMSSLEAAERVLGIDTSNVTVWKGAAPEGAITSEMLRDAYYLAKEILNTNKGYIPKYGDLQELTEYLAQSFKGNVKEGEWKTTPELLEKVLEAQTAILDRAAKNDSQIRDLYNALPSLEEQRQFALSLAKELMLRGKLSKSDFLLVKNALNLIRNSRNKPVENQTASETSKPQITPEQRNAEIAKRLNEIEEELLKFGFVDGILRNPGIYTDESPQILPLVKEYKKLLAQIDPLKSTLDAKKATREKLKTAKLEEQKAIEENKAIIDKENNILDVFDKDPEVIKLREELENLPKESSIRRDIRKRLEERYIKIQKELLDAKLSSKEKELVANELIKLINEELDNINEDLKSLIQGEYDKIERRSDIRDSIALFKRRIEYLKTFHGRIKTFKRNLGSLVDKDRSFVSTKERIRHSEEQIAELEKELEELRYHKQGGNIEFAKKVLLRNVLKFAGGNKVPYLPVGNNYSAAVLPNFEDPYGTGWNNYLRTWFETIGSLQLSGILQLLLLNSKTWLGNNGFVAKQNQLKNTLDKGWTAAYKLNNGALYGTNVGQYLTDVIGLDPVKQALLNAYSNGRYVTKSKGVSSGEYAGTPDNFFSAITHDASIFGNVNWLTEEDKKNYRKTLKSLVGDKYKFAVDSNGYIYPVDINLTTLGTGENWFYTNDYVDNEGVLTLPEGNVVTNTSSTTQQNPIPPTATLPIIKPQISREDNKFGIVKAKQEGKSGPTPEGETIPDIKTNPLYNINWLDLINLGVSQIGTVDARNAIKFRPVKKTFYTEDYRVTTGDNTYQTKKAYSGLFNSADTSSDARYNSAVRLNLGTNYVKALLEAFAKDSLEFYTNLSNSQKTILNNLERRYSAYNENLANDIAARKYHDELNELMKTRLWTNVRDYILKKSTDLDNLNKVKSARYWQIYSDKIEHQRQLDIYSTLLKYWNMLSDEDKKRYDNKITTYLTSPDFTGDPRILYENEIRKINSNANKNIEALINGLYTTNPTDIEFLKTYGSLLKEGGQIKMAKKGSNLNWAKIENARMINKSINDSIKETYKNIRAANRELQKTIRAMAPMMKQLNTQGLK